MDGKDSKDDAESHKLKLSLQQPATHVAFELPKASVELLGHEGFKVQLEKLRSENLFDQSTKLVTARGQGCISSPTGPTC